MARYHMVKPIACLRRLCTLQRSGPTFVGSTFANEGGTLPHKSKTQGPYHRHLIRPQVRSMEMVSDVAPGTSPPARNDWLPETADVFTRLQARAESEPGWVLFRNTAADPPNRRFLFSRVTTANGPVIHYAIFLNKERRALCGVCQFGEEAQGPPGFVHGGASATIHDVNTGVLAQHAVTERVVTASLNTNYRKPTPLRTPLLMEASIEKIEGKKIFLKSSLKSPDGASLYSDCSALFINIEEKLRALQASGGL